MRIAKFALAGLVIALAVAAVVVFWEYVVMGIAILVGALLMIGLVTGPSAPISPEEEQRRRNFMNYVRAQELAEQREAHREAMAEWWQQRQPPPRDPSTWGGGDGSRYC
jgi:predicted membrane protein